MIRATCAGRPSMSWWTKTSWMAWLPNCMCKASRIQRNIELRASALIKSSLRRKTSGLIEGLYDYEWRKLPTRRSGIGMPSTCGVMPPLFQVCILIIMPSEPKARNTATKQNACCKQKLKMWSLFNPWSGHLSLGSFNARLLYDQESYPAEAAMHSCKHPLLLGVIIVRVRGF